MDGVSEVEVDLRAKTARVRGREGTSPAAVAEAIEAAGSYRVVKWNE